MKYKLIAGDGYADKHEERVNEFLEENPNIKIEIINTWVKAGNGWNTTIIYTIGKDNGSQ